MASTKGNDFCVCGGKYSKMTGWIDASKRPSGKRAFVSADFSDGSEKATYTKKKNIECAHSPPSTCAEAIFQQQPKAEKKLKELCAMLAKCQIGFQNCTSGLMPIIERELKKATEEQNKLGNDVEYRFILFPAVPIAPDDNNGTQTGVHIS